MQWLNEKLTRFEAARLIGARSLQIALGAPVLIKTDESNPTKVARLELLGKLIPITIKRKMPNGQYSVVNIKKAIDNWMRDRNGEI
jgi:DNA-directed RNA polymerase subunit K